MQICLLLVQTEDVGQSGRLAEMEPSLVVQIEAEVASEQEEAGDQAVQGRRLEMVVALPHPQRLLHQQVARDQVRARQAVEAERIARYPHPGLDHHKRAERGQEAVGVDVLVGVLGLLFDPAAVEDGQGRVHVGEEELDAILNHLVGEQAGCRRQRRAAWRTADPIQSIGNLRRERRLSLRLAEFADHLRPRAFGPFLLRDGVVGTRQLSRGAIATRIDAVAFHLATMAGVASPLDRRRHGGRGRFFKALLVDSTRTRRDYRRRGV